jgi:hypothetical protein
LIDKSFIMRSSRPMLDIIIQPFIQSKKHHSEIK